VLVNAREEEIRQTETNIKNLATKIEDMSQAQQNKRAEFKQLEQQRDEAQAESNRTNRQFADIRAQLNSQEERRNQLSARITGLDTDLSGLVSRIDENDGSIKAARARLESAMEVLEGFADQQTELEQSREPLKVELQAAREQVNFDQEKMQTSAIRFESRKAAYDSTKRT